MSEESRPESGDQMPFVAPCRRVGPGAPFRWIAAGYRDMRAAPRLSLGWGLIVLALSWLVSLPPLLIGNKFALLGLLSGFVFLGPLLAIALYAISWRLEHSRAPTFRRSLAESAEIRKLSSLAEPWSSRKWSGTACRPPQASLAPQH